MKKRFPDILGIFVSIICAVHCTILPFILAYAGIHSSQGSHRLFDFIILSIALVVLFSTIRKKITKQNLPLITFLILAGFVCYFLSFCFQSTLSHFLFATGSVFWLIVHAKNLKTLSKV